MEVISGFIALVGVIIISRPAFLFGMLHKQEHDPSDDVPEKMRIRAVMVALLGVCGASFAYVMIRKIGRRAHPLVSVSYFALWAFLVSTVGLLVTPGLGFVFLELSCNGDYCSSLASLVFYSSSVLPLVFKELLLEELLRPLIPSCSGPWCGKRCFGIRLPTKPLLLADPSF